MGYLGQRVTVVILVQQDLLDPKVKVSLAQWVLQAFQVYRESRALRALASQDLRETLASEDCQVCQAQKERVCKDHRVTLEGKDPLVQMGPQGKVCRAPRVSRGLRV